jgi:sporulation protein YqfC
MIKEAKRMKLKDELIYDFSINMPRLLISGRSVVIDNVKKVALVTDQNIVVDCKGAYTSLSGKNFVINQLEDERMLVTGEIRKIEFFGSLTELTD